jgi:hypothetical protein
MTTLAYLLALAPTRRCRRCAEAIPAHDAFGHSEGICSPCRRG